MTSDEEIAELKARAEAAEGAYRQQQIAIDYLRRQKLAAEAQVERLWAGLSSVGQRWNDGLLCFCHTVEQGRAGHSVECLTARALLAAPAVTRRATDEQIEEVARRMETVLLDFGRRLGLSAMDICTLVNNADPAVQGVGERAER